MSVYPHSTPDPTDGSHPPSWADALLEGFCASDLLEDIQGDLHELFYKRAQQYGLGITWLWYWLDVVRFVRPYVLKRNPDFEEARGPIMWKNYFKIAHRNLTKHVGYSIINIGGLALGIASCILILLYVQDELAFDSHHPESERIYRIVEHRVEEGQADRHLALAMGPFAPALETNFPEVIESVRMLDRNSIGRFAIQQNASGYYEGNHLITEPSFFRIFDAPMQQGNPETALAEPNTVVLTEAAAERLFGRTNAMGQTVETDRWGSLQVTGIVSTPQFNSHLQYSMLISMGTITANEQIERFVEENWNGGSIISYIKLDERNDAATLGTKFSDFLAQYHNEEAQARRSFYLQPVQDIHFGSQHIEQERNASKGDRTYLFIFSAIALFVVLIGCINYMNLATARAMRRAKEVGLRKVVGARHQQLIGQFLGESILVALLALVIALGLVALLLQPFNTLADKAMTLSWEAHGAWLFSLLGIAFIVGIVSGSYPAFFLARFRPVRVLKGEVKASGGALWLRRGLVVTQFALSIGMIIATVVVLNQLDYIQNKRLGFNQEQLVVVDINSGASRNQFRTIKDEYSRLPFVEHVSASSRIPGEWKNILTVTTAREGQEPDQATAMQYIGVDPDFLDTFEIEMADGRNFSEDLAMDSTGILINETAARMMGWPNAIDQPLNILTVGTGGQARSVNFNANVIGVVKDFHYRSLHEEIGPIILGYWNNPIQRIDYYTLRVSAGTPIPTALTEIEAVYSRFDPDTPMEYNFLDARLNDFYIAEQRVATLFSIAAGLTILIACLGLFGLAAFTAEQRTKEIGVRKVLGASVGSIVLLLSKEFVRLVLAAFLVATPVAYLLMSRWLDNFAYSTSLSIGTLALAGGLTLLVALATVSYQAIRAAVSDPVKTLRYE